MLKGVHTSFYPVQISDLAYLPVPPAEIAQAINDQRQWPAWFPGLELQVTENRGELGIRWLAGGQVDGTSEIWLEKVDQGTYIHYFLHGEPTTKTAPAKVTMRYRLRFKNLVNELRNRLDGDRPAGENPQEWRAQNTTARSAQ